MGWAHCECEYTKEAGSDRQLHASRVSLHCGQSYHLSIYAVHLAKGYSHEDQDIGAERGCPEIEDDEELSLAQQLAVTYFMICPSHTLSDPYTMI